MGSATGTSKGHAKSIHWVLYGGEAFKEAKSKNAQRESAATRERILISHQSHVTDGCGMGTVG
jgi:hypothetical protein